MVVRTEHSGNGGFLSSGIYSAGWKFPSQRSNAQAPKLRMTNKLEAKGENRKHSKFKNLSL